MVFDNDSEQVLRLHLKVMEIEREGWVVLPQLAVGVHDFGSPLQKQRIPANYPVHRNASEKFSFQSHRNWTLLSPSMACTKPNQTTHPWTIGHHKLHCILNHKQQILCQYWYHMAANVHQTVVLCVKSTPAYYPHITPHITLFIIIVSENLLFPIPQKLKTDLAVTTIHGILSRLQ